ncbi:hypothetical protein VNO77_02828 [Canavalia gladiata]|uniref:Uncharacterized protein n=1 Tax=Canavalia gladiata TaxID=3824 RepID=A0AAN9RBM6_CANGL
MSCSRRRKNEGLEVHPATLWSSASWHMKRSHSPDYERASSHEMVDGAIFALTLILSTQSPSPMGPGVRNCLRPLDGVWEMLEKALLTSANSPTETLRSAGRARTRSAGSRRGADDYDQSLKPKAYGA